MICVSISFGMIPGKRELMEPSRELIYTDLYIDVVIRGDYRVYTKFSG